MRAPTFYQKCRDQLWYINHLDHQHNQQVQQIRNLKDRLAIETAKAKKGDSTFEVDKGSPQIQVIMILDAR